MLSHNFPELQHDRENALPTDLDTESYFRVNIAVPFLDHLNQQFNTRFSKESRTGSILIQISPKAIIKKPRSSMAELAEDLKFWQEDLPHDLSTLKSELRMWWDKWHGTEIEQQPKTLKES